MHLEPLIKETSLEQMETTMKKNPISIIYRGQWVRETSASTTILLPQREQCRHEGGKIVKAIEPGSLNEIMWTSSGREAL